MRARSRPLTAALAVTTVSALFASGMASAATGRAAHPARQVLPSTAPGPEAGPALRAMPDASRVRVSVFIGRYRADLAAAARAISDPASPRYAHYLTPAQVRARYGATASQQAAVSGWLRQSGRDPP
jgi:Pro-kumamolisin, activation domain